MLASVFVRSRPVPEDQFVEKTDGPNGPLLWPLPLKFVLCGIEPARSLWSKAALFAATELPLLMSPMDGDDVLYGLAEGVGRVVKDGSVGKAPCPPARPFGENRDGRVPARARLE